MIKYPPLPLLIGLLFLPFFAHAQETSITYHGKEGPGKGKHVVFLSGR